MSDKFAIVQISSNQVGICVVSEHKYFPHDFIQGEHFCPGLKLFIFGRKWVSSVVDVEGWRHPCRGLFYHLRDPVIIWDRIRYSLGFRFELVDKQMEERMGQIVDGIAVDMTHEGRRHLRNEGIPFVAAVLAVDLGQPWSNVSEGCLEFESFKLAIWVSHLPMNAKSLVWTRISLRSASNQKLRTGTLSISIKYISS
jgi:hypothetical protein